MRIITLLLLCFSASAQVVPFAFLGNRPAAAGGGSPAVPGQVQRFSLSSTRMDGGNIFTNTGTMSIPLPEASQAGNALILFAAASGNANATVTLADDQTNTWTQATYGAHSGNRKHIWAWIALNVRTNTRMLWLTNTSGFALTNAEAAGFEYYNIASANALDGTNTFGATAATTASAGNITPTQTGNLFMQYVVRDGSTFTNTLFTAGSQANMTWALQSADLNDGLASQDGIYSSTATINPQLTMGTAGDYISAAISLKTATQGAARPSGIQIGAILHQSVDNGVPKTIISQFPAGGNLLVEGWQAGSADFRVTNVTDSAGNVWTLAPGSTATNGAGCSQFWYASNATASSTLKVTNFVASTATGHGTIMFHDIFGAATIPFDYATFAANAQTVANSLTNPPGLTPSTANGLVLYQTEQDFNTVSNVSPGFIDVAVWTGNNPDGPSNLDENNGWGHSKNTDNTTTIAPVWKYQVPGEAISKFTAAMASFMPPGGTRLHPAFVQSAQAVNTSATTLNCAFSANNTAANLIVVAFRIGANGRTITLSDSKGNTYAAALSVINDGQGDDTAIYYAKNIGAGANTVTLAISGAAASIRYSIHEYSGCSTSSPFDKTNSAAFTGASLATTTLTGATTGAREVLFVMLEDGLGSSSAYVTPDYHWTFRETISGRLVTMDQVVSATGTYTGNLSWTGGSSTGIIGFATFK
jgi:hypothetical protein